MSSGLPKLTPTAICLELWGICGLSTPADSHTQHATSVNRKSTHTEPAPKPALEPELAPEPAPVPLLRMALEPAPEPPAEPTPEAASEAAARPSPRSLLWLKTPTSFPVGEKQAL